MDIGRLRPVEAVQLYEKAGLLFLKTDTGDVGWGLTVEQAVRKMKETAPGEIYLDTADYLVLEEGAETYLDSLRYYLKDRTAMVYGTERVNLQQVVSYLRMHRPSGKLGNSRIPKEMLSIEGGKMVLKIFQEK